jgi:glutamine---fructose-6-phosphate transaminase (isomerizing)
MCGLFGVIAEMNSKYSNSDLKDILFKAARFSEVRGQDSAGIVFRNLQKNQFNIIRGPVPISMLLKSEHVVASLSNILVVNTIQQPVFAAMGHARLTTNGTQLQDNNNQPVIKDGIVGIHNGIIVNADELWLKNKDLIKKYDIDTEILLSLIRKYICSGSNSVEAVNKAINEIYGTVSSVFFFADRDQIILSSNNGSLYTLTNNRDILVFASENYILEKLLSNTTLKKYKDLEIKQVTSDTGLLLELQPFKFHPFDKFFKFNGKVNCQRHPSLESVVTVVEGNNKQLSTVIDINKISFNISAGSERKLLEFNIDRVNGIKRCKRCILPETFPFISFDNEGVCNICRNYVPKNLTNSIDELLELVEPYKRKDHKPDCLVPFSGGRDSTYTLHIVKNILKMNPIAFTYDWGMVTDLGRRNIARVCGKLGVENVIVSANIHRKRENIKKNILAWSKNPDLGMIPLFMAGDKYFFYFADKLKKQNHIKLNIWGINPLENTDFKVGFCGLPLRFNKERIYSISKLDQLRLLGYVGKNLIKSPLYFNQSIFDTIGSFASRYVVPKKDYYHMFDFYRWDEKEIEDLIINEYKWETAIDTKTTWRIGDGTAAFYNYIYFTVAGFSEYDTFRSNQIREGMIDRNTALTLVNEENIPRYESIKWYLEIIGLDYEPIIKIINKISKLY